MDKVFEVGDRVRVRIPHSWFDGRFGTVSMALAWVYVVLDEDGEEYAFRAEDLEHADSVSEVAVSPASGGVWLSNEENARRDKVLEASRYDRDYWLEHYKALRDEYDGVLHDLREVLGKPLGTWPELRNEVENLDALAHARAVAPVDDGRRFVSRASLVYRRLGGEWQFYNPAEGWVRGSNQDGAYVEIAGM